jgi:hypothetical protein
MSQPHEPTENVMILISRAVQGTLTDDESRTLEQLLTADPALQQLYVEQMLLDTWLNRSLSAEFLGGAIDMLAGVAPVQPPPPRRRWRRVLLAASLLIGVGLAVAVWWMTFPRSAVVPEPQVVQNEEPRLAEAPKKADIRGRILSLEGKPLIGAQVTALAHRLFMPGERTLHDQILAVGKTDDEGRFHLSVAADFPTWYPDRRVALFVHASGEGLHTVQVPLPSIAVEEDAVVDPIEVRLSKAETVRGRLLDAAGKPAKGVTLRVARLGNVAFDPVAAGRPTDDLPGWPGLVISDAEGRFELSGIGPSEMVSFRVEDDRFAPHSIALTPGKAEDSLRLQPLRWIEGRVIAADTGAPLAGVRLTADAVTQQKFGVHTVADEQVPLLRWMTTVDTRTDLDGRFRIRSFPQMSHILEFHPPPGSPYLAVRKQQGPGMAGIPNEVSLPRGVVVRGQMTDELTGQPIPGGSVFWDAPVDGVNLPFDPSVVQEASGITRTDAEGRFTLTIPTGPVRLQGFGPTQEYIARPISEWTRMGISDRHGWKLTPTSPDQAIAYCHAETFLELTPDAPPPSLTLSLHKGRTVRGEVLAADGGPVPRAILLCDGRVSPLRNGWGQPLPVERGRFVLPGCEEGKVYTILVLDKYQEQGAVAEVSCPEDPEHRPRIRLQPCGKGLVRVKPAGKALPASIAPLFPSMFPYLYLRLPKPHLPGEPPRDPGTATLVDDLGINMIYTLDHRRVDKAGELTLSGLIPGAEYLLSWQIQRGWISLPHTRVFRVKPGEALKLPDVVPGLPRDNP